MEENKPVEKAPDMVLTQGAVAAEKAVEQKPKKSGNGKKIVGITTFVLGLIMLVVGVVFLVLNLLKQPETRDADRLVEVGKWVREDNDGVIWDFSEIGKGTLTTNSHMNEYEFIWSAENGKLKIETDWLYTLNDDYNYELKDNKLILNDSIVFVPVDETEEQPEEQPDEQTDEEPEAQPDEQPGEQPEE